MLIRLHQLIAGRRGQALVELALILPILLMLIFGVIEFGRVLGSYLIITHAAREGARAGVVGAGDDDIYDTVINAAPLVALTEDDITITPVSAERVRGQALTVQVDCTVDIIAPFLDAILTDPFPLRAQTTMRIE